MHDTAGEQDSFVCCACCAFLHNVTRVAYQQSVGLTVTSHVHRLLIAALMSVLLLLSMNET
jgi:hypothetical protein